MQKERGEYEERFLLSTMPGEVKWTVFREIIN
jgi:hypothetical protein